MDIVAIEKNSKITLQLAERTEDVQLGAHPSVPGFSDDALWETPDHRFVFRPSQKTTKHFLLIGGKTYSVISDGVSLAVLNKLLSEDRVVNQLFEKGFVAERYENEK